jgi:phosphoribosylamine--glycine ligase
MKILIVGGGGREHALAWAIHRSEAETELYAAPGNAGTAGIGTNVDVGAGDIDALVRFAGKTGIDLVVVGPENPIEAGIRDDFDRVRIPCFAPRKKAAFLEASKMRAKAFMQRHNVPTAYYAAFSEFKSALSYVQSVKYPLVIKADGLAAGKGVSIVDSAVEARDVLEEFMIGGRFGDASRTVVLEEYLRGPELSVFCVTDGSAFKVVGTATDYKRQLEGDRGPNTGGMGSVSPAPILEGDRLAEVMNAVVKPTFRGLQAEGLSYEGVLYFGVIWTEDGPKVLEYNVRFGDPETQVLVPLYDFDFLEMILATVRGGLADFPVRLHGKASVGVILASGGYPGSYGKGKRIRGIGEAEALENVTVFHAGTQNENGHLVTSGGRVLAVVGIGNDMKGARETAYAGVSRVTFEGMQYREDIGKA